MIIEKTLKNGSKAWLVRVGRKPAKQFSEAEWGNKKLAKAKAREHEAKLMTGAAVRQSVTCGPYTDRFLDHAEREVLKTGRRRKASTMSRLTYAGNGFRDTFGFRLLTGVDRTEARDWSLSATPDQIRFATQLFNRALEEGLLAVNPFRGLTPATPGRSGETPPSLDEWEALRQAWTILGDKYASMGRALFVFASFSGMRPGELFALEWDDVDFDAMRISVSRRVYHGNLDLPKSNKARRIVLTPPARDALLPLERYARTIFVGKRGQRISEATLSNYWGQVKAKAGVDHDFYFATKHRFVHDAYVGRQLSPNAIAQQMGWSVSSVEEMLKIYGHGDTGWEAEWEQSYGDNVVHLEAVGE